MEDAEVREDAQEQAPAAGADEVKAWEEIDAGRYMPRRIRGSFRGGKLG